MTPPLPELAESLAGVQWWRPRDLVNVQAEAVAAMVRDGRCDRHAALIGELVAWTIRDEFTRRHILAIPAPER